MRLKGWNNITLQVGLAAERCEFNHFAAQSQFYSTVIFMVIIYQHAKKVVSNSPELVDLAIGLVIFVLNLPNRQVLFFGEIQVTEGL